jgi:hypothetical protein
MQLCVCLYRITLVPQAGFCEGEVLDRAASNLVTLPRPKGGSKLGTQSRPKLWARPLYSTTWASLVRYAISFYLARTPKDVPEYVAHWQKCAIFPAIACSYEVCKNKYMQHLAG